MKLQKCNYPNLTSSLNAECTEVRISSFLSKGFNTTYGSNKSTRRETGKTHLCAVWWGLRITGELEVLMITKCVNTDGKFLPYGPTICIPSPPAQWNTIWPPCTCRHEYQLVLLFVSITEWKMAILLVLSAFSAFSIV